MTLAYWCVLLAIFIPLACAAYGKVKGNFKPEDNHNVRAFFEKSEGVAARANAAQLNSYEIFPAFAAGVIIAHLTGGAAQVTINLWAFIFILSRMVYCYCYIADLAKMRSLVWATSFVSVIALFIAAA